MNIRPVRMVMGDPGVRMAVTMFSIGVFFHFINVMEMHMVKIIMPVTVLMHQWMMGVDVSVCFGEKKDYPDCHYRQCCKEERGGIK